MKVDVIMRWLCLFTYGHFVAGQYTLIGSDNYSTSGIPFTFTCTTSPVQIAVQWVETNSPGAEKPTTNIYIYFYNAHQCQRSIGAPPADYSFNCNSSGVFTLTFTVSYTRHKGSEWTCGNAQGPGTSNRITLDVRVSLTSVVLLNATSSPVTATQGTVVSLVCETNPTDPMSAITWRRDSQTVSQDVTSSSRSDAQGIVAISVWSKSVQWGDHGDYNCQATNSGKSASSQTLLLIIHVPGSSVSLINITTNNQEINVTEDSIFVLSCRTSSSNPAPTVTWYINNTPTSSDVVNQAETQTSGQVVMVSTITRTVRRANDRDQTYCRAENGFGDKQSWTTIANVHYPPDIRMDPAEGLEKTNITLRCIASGYPAIYRFEDFTQYWGNQLIQRRAGSHSGDRYDLILSRVTYQDSGVYVCTVGNNVKQQRHRNTTVVVKGSPIFTNDAIPNKRVSAEIGQDIHITQYIYCSPIYTSVNWNFTAGSSTITLSSTPSNVALSQVHLDVYGVDVETDGYRVSYNVINFQQKDIGLYTVFVCNSVGCSTSSVKLTKSDTSPTSSSLGVGAGIGIGVGICVIVVIGAVVIFIIAKRRKALPSRKHRNKPQVTNTDADRQLTAVTTTSSAVIEQSQYTELQPNTNPNQYETLDAHHYQNADREVRRNVYETLDTKQGQNYEQLNTPNNEHTAKRSGDQTYENNSFSAD